MTKLVSLTTLMLLLGGAPGSAADVMRLDFAYEEPSVSWGPDGDIVELEGCQIIAHVGEPLLPVHGVSVLLPAGHELEGVEIVPGDPVILPGTFDLPIAQRQYPFSYVGPVEVVELSDRLKGSPDPHPAYLHANETTHFLAGHGLGSFTLHPVRYIPATGTLLYYPHMSVLVTTTTTARAQEALARLYRDSHLDRERIQRATPFIQELDTYPAQRGGRRNDFDILLIAESSLLPEFDPYITHKTLRGWKIVTRTVGSTSSYPGADTQERIRNCIKDYYENYGIQYVLLGGDDETIPHRGFWFDPGWGLEDYDIPADLYYAALDGTWNDDGDAKWGEPSEADLLAEVFVARVCADNAAEVSRFISKTALYEDEPVVAECDKALMVGEKLWDDPTWGGDSKDEIKSGASTHGYTTVGFPNPGNVETLYDRDIPGSWNAMSDLLPLLNGGVHFVNHLGHSNVGYYMRFYNSNITDANFTNNGVNHSLYITYSQGCYCGSFDNRTTGGSYTSDCINERITTEISNGAVAAIANSRYGWGAHESTNGSSQYFDRQFFDAVFGEGITNIAWANQDSREDNIWAISYAQNRWCYYELTVFGDPLLDMWTAQPTTMAVNYPSAYIIGGPTFTVTVTGVAGARVALSRDGQLLGRGFTDVSGVAVVEFDDPPQTPGAMDVVVTAHDRLPFQGTANVADPDGPYVVCIDHTIDDDMNGNSWGDADGEVELGETIELPLLLENVGTEQAAGVIATVSTSQSYVQFSQDSQTYGDIDIGAQVWSAGSYVFSVVQDCPDRTGVTIEVSATDGSETWVSYVSIMVNSPVLYLASFQISEVSGNGNGQADAGETIAITSMLGNSGHGTAWSVTGDMSSGDGYTTINSGSAGYPDISPESTVGSSVPFQVEFSPSTPLGHLVDFSVDVTAAGGYAETVGFTLCVGKKSLLVVDTDNETTETRIITALDDLGEDYDQWAWFTAGSPGLDELLRYETVIWASGDQNASTGTAQDRQDLGAFLDQGGSLLYSAENYLTQYPNESFTTEYLHIADHSVNVTVFNSVVGEAGDPIGDGLNVSISYPSDLSETPDTVEPDAQSAVVFRSGSANQSTVIRYPATGDGPYRMMFFGTPLEAFSSSGAGDNNISGVLSRSLAWMRGSADIQAPSAPAWIAMTTAGELTWDPATDNVGVTGYKLYRATEPYFSIDGLSPLASPSSANWSAPGSVGNTEINYYFIVTACDEADNESLPSPIAGEHDFAIEN